MNGTRVYPGPNGNLILMHGQYGQTGGMWYCRPEGEPIREMTADEVREVEAECKPVTSTNDDSLIIAFVQGAAWWEHHEKHATMWPADRDKAEWEAQRMLAQGVLGNRRVP